MSEELEEFNEFGEENEGEGEIQEDIADLMGEEDQEEGGEGEQEDEIFFETLEEEMKVTEEDEKVVEQGEDYSRWALDVASSRSTATADLVVPIERSPLRTEPAYRTIVGIVRRILEDLVSRGRENVLSFFDEYIVRLEQNLKETFGLPQNVFLPTAYMYENAIRSHYISWKDAIEEYLHEYGTEYDFMETAEMAAFEVGYEMGGEDEMPDKYNLPPDDFNEGGYKHFEDRKLEAKEPDYDEFAYVTLEQLAFAEEAGVGLPRHEHFEIHMALQRLEKVRRLRSVKFWGKIFGLCQDYYIAEAEMDVEDMKVDDFDELPDYPESEMVGEYDEEFAVEEEQRPVVEEMSDDEWEKIRMEYAEMYGEGYGENFPETQLKEKSKPFLEEQEIAVQLEDELEEESTIAEAKESEFELEVNDKSIWGKQTLKTYKIPPLPIIKEKPPKLPPLEDPGKGTNKVVFFVTNDPKTDWIRLPLVTPDQITTARQIRKFFTGYLSARVVSYPKFPGIEINLLRAQIARISAGTQVSPAGYFRFDDGEEAAEAIDAGKVGKVLLNREYEPLSVKDLTDPTCTFWVHHTDYILNQGRVAWYNVNKKEPKKLGEEEEMMDEDEGEEAPPLEEVIGERGPPILTSCAEDLFLEEIPPWTVRPAIELAPVQGCVYVRSNLWPGSLSWTFGRKIGFIYVGWGVKAVAYGYTPPPPFPPRIEYPSLLSVTEKLDPTPAQEEEYRKKIEEWLARFKKPEEMGEGEGEGEGENEEEEE